MFYWFKFWGILESIENAKNMICKVWNYHLDDATLLTLYTEINYWQSKSET